MYADPWTFPYRANSLMTQIRVLQRLERRYQDAGDLSRASSAAIQVQRRREDIALLSEGERSKWSRASDHAPRRSR
jgi:hypothetical protein